MLRSFALALLLAVGGILPADAACYGPLQIRQMVVQGQIIALSSVLGEINAVGQPISVPRLCDDGGGLAYEVDVVQSGSVVHLRVDARNGRITQ
jgi:hypothetical protein